MHPIHSISFELLLNVLINAKINSTQYVQYVHVVKYTYGPRNDFKAREGMPQVHSLRGFRHY